MVHCLALGGKKDGRGVHSVGCNHHKQLASAGLNSWRYWSCHKPNSHSPDNASCDVRKTGSFLLQRWITSRPNSVTIALGEASQDFMTELDIYIEWYNTCCRGHEPAKIPSGHGCLAVLVQEKSRTPLQLSSILKFGYFSSFNI